MASVTFESFISQHSIEIPAIQRDYVQGRATTPEEKDKREAFVTKLVQSIATSEEPAKPCHLEFIYGAVNDHSHSFIPLDGQQRLTTLFLLHWVVWQKSNEDAKREFPLSLMNEFKYKTRISSLNFCHDLVNHELLPTDQAQTLEETIKAQPWFSEDWNHDPTIASMLSMIAFMEEKLKPYSQDSVSAMLTRLCNADNAITFDQLDMNEYQLTDSLYIKMNARGKQLTPFENWKSSFIQFLEQSLADEEYVHADHSRHVLSYSYKDYFCYSIEHEWTDLFWNYLKDDFIRLDAEQQSQEYPCIDRMFMNLFDMLCQYRYYAQFSRRQDKEDYHETNAGTRRAIWQNKDFVDYFFGTLDALCRMEHKMLFDGLFYLCSDEVPSSDDDGRVRLFRTEDTNLFRLCVDHGTSMELTDMLLFHALTDFLVANRTTAVTDALKAYMRHVRNYLESNLQNLKSRTTVQLNLRFGDFKKYDKDIQGLLRQPLSTPSVQECLIDDFSLTHGCSQVFGPAVQTYGHAAVIEALHAFSQASAIQRIRLLVACGYRGTYLSDCIGRQRYFFGSDDRWDVLFITDADQLTRCFQTLTGKIATERKTVHTIIADALQVEEEKKTGFRYYLLKYDAFLEANNGSHHFAVRGDLDDVDWIALGSYSSNPGTAYHCDPIAAAVEKIVHDRHPDWNMALYKQYSGKCPLSLVKDKVHWEPTFSMVCRKDGWHVTLGRGRLTEDTCKELGAMHLGDDDLLIPLAAHKDLVEMGCELMEKATLCP